MRVRLTLLAMLAALTACSPEQEQAWFEWFERDPKAATVWAVNECGPLCTDDWDRDGVVEPEPSADISDSSAVEPLSNDSDGWTDVTTDGDTWGVYEPWISLAECESGSSPPNWHIDTGNGYHGGLQFTWSSWESVGGTGNPADASPSEQVYRGELLQDAQGWGAWPTCARRVGLL